MGYLFDFKAADTTWETCKWIAPRLGEVDGTVGSILPDGFEAYVRIRSDGVDRGDSEEQSRSTGTISEALARRIAAYVQPVTGRRCVFAIWTSWPWLKEAVRASEPLVLAGREYWAYDGFNLDVINLAEYAARERLAGGANYWWAETKEWILVTDVRLRDSYIACRGDLATVLCNEVDLKPLRVERDQPLTPETFWS